MTWLKKYTHKSVTKSTSVIDTKSHSLHTGSTHPQQLSRERAEWNVFSVLYNGYLHCLDYNFWHTILYLLLVRVLKM